jgi:cytochrome c oxidase cbb3-type subunit 2
MKTPLLIFLGAPAVLLGTAVTVIALPAQQFAVTPPESGLHAYSAEEEQGRASYVSLGCVYCHSQQPRDRNFAPDETRGWGRASTPGDYAYDYPHQLGTMRTGPDLFNIGARQPSADWHLVHLYEPRALVPWSVMPAYPFLFERKATPSPEDVIVQLPPGKGAAGDDAQGVLVARPEARALVAYLQSLDHTYPSDYIPTAGADAGAQPQVPR